MAEATTPLRRLDIKQGRSLYCSTELLPVLAAEAQAPYATDPSGGMEMGGVLLGSRAGGLLTILERIPAECEHEYGPSFELTQADKARLQQMLECLAEGDRDIVGWYRTSSKEFAMTGPDIEIAESFFSEPNHVTLIIRRNKQEKPVFGFWLRASTGDWKCVAQVSLGGQKPIAPIPKMAVPAANLAAHARPPSRVPSPEPAMPAPKNIPSDISPPLAQPEVVPEAPTAPPQVVEPAIEPYLEYFGLLENPFRDCSDPRFWVDTPAHKEAFSKLLYGIHARKGCLVLLGGAGTGKTLLLERFTDRLRADRVEYAFLSNSRLNAEEFFELLALDLDLACQSYRKVQVLVPLQERVIEAAQRGSTVVLIVDNAHRLAPEVLEEIDLLGNFESRRGKLLQVVLSGDLSLEQTVVSPAMQSLRQRIGIWARLSPLDQAATADYIVGRLQNAGSRTDIFTETAAAEVWSATKGVPRLINLLGSAALQLAYTLDQRQTTPELVREAAQRLELDLMVVTEQMNAADERARN